MIEDLQKRVDMIDKDVHDVIMIMGMINAIQGLITSLDKANEIIHNGEDRTMKVSQIILTLIDIQKKQIKAMEKLLKGKTGNSLSELIGEERDKAFTEFANVSTSIN